MANNSDFRRCAKSQHRGSQSSEKSSDSCKSGSKRRIHPTGPTTPNKDICGCADCSNDDIEHGVSHVVVLHGNETKIANKSQMERFGMPAELIDKAVQVGGQTVIVETFVITTPVSLEEEDEEDEEEAKEKEEEKQPVARHIIHVQPAATVEETTNTDELCNRYPESAPRESVCKIPSTSFEQKVSPIKKKVSYVTVEMAQQEIPPALNTGVCKCTSIIIKTRNLSDEPQADQIHESLAESLESDETSVAPLDEILYLTPSTEVISLKVPHDNLEKQQFLSQDVCPCPSRISITTRRKSSHKKDQNNDDPEAVEITYTYLQPSRKWATVTTIPRLKENVSRTQDQSSMKQESSPLPPITKYNEIEKKESEKSFKKLQGKPAKSVKCKCPSLLCCAKSSDQVKVTPTTEFSFKQTQSKEVMESDMQKRDQNNFVVSNAPHFEDTDIKLTPTQNECTFTHLENRKSVSIHSVEQLSESGTYTCYQDQAAIVTVGTSPQQEEQPQESNLMALKTTPLDAKNLQYCHKCAVRNNLHKTESNTQLCSNVTCAHANRNNVYIQPAPPVRTLVLPDQQELSRKIRNAELVSAMPEMVTTRAHAITIPPFANKIQLIRVHDKEDWCCHTEDDHSTESRKSPLRLTTRRRSSAVHWQDRDSRCTYCRNCWRVWVVFKIVELVFLFLNLFQSVHYFYVHEVHMVIPTVAIILVVLKWGFLSCGLIVTTLLLMWAALKWKPSNTSLVMVSIIGAIVSGAVGCFIAIYLQNHSAIMKINLNVLLLAAIYLLDVVYCLFMVSERRKIAY